MQVLSQMQVRHRFPQARCIALGSVIARFPERVRERKEPSRYLIVFRSSPSRASELILRREPKLLSFERQVRVSHKRAFGNAVPPGYGFGLARVTALKTRPYQIVDSSFLP